MTHHAPLKRRTFLGSTAAAAGLTVVIPLPSEGATATELRVNPYVQVTPDNIVRVVMPGCEIGQGVFTGLPKILCEELEADWDKVEIKLSAAEDAYNNPLKKRQSTGN